jgi:hypothetical protein
MLRALAGSMTCLSTKASQCAAEDACCTRRIEPGTFAQREGPSFTHRRHRRLYSDLPTPGIDIVELSSRFVTSLTDWLRLIVRSSLWASKCCASSSVAALWEPEIGIQSGAGEPSAIAACGGRVVTCRGERAGI